MPGSDATMKFKADISELKAAMQQASRAIKVANSEFKAGTAGMDRWNNSADGLTKKLKQLDTVLKAQKTQLSLAKQELEKTKQVYGENSAETDRARIKVNNYQAAVNKTEKELNHYEQELEGVKNGVKDTGDAAEKSGKDAEKGAKGFTVMKGALADLVASGIRAAINGLKDLGRAAMDAYEEFDDGYDNVIKATGATGETADQLAESYKNVAKSVRGEFGDLGSALGEVNTRFGYTGEELENATVQFQKFSEITGTDATKAVQLVSRAMGDAGIDSSEYATVLDELAVAAQASGISVDKLTENITKYGAPMRALGFDTKESIALFSQWEKAGVNTEIAFSGMKKAISNWGKDGKDAREEFKKTLKEIEETPDIASATTKAIEVFGAKAGPDLADAIKGGRFAYEDFLELIEGSAGAVTNTYEQTEDGFDKVKLTIQGVRADMGAFVGELLSKYEPQITAFIEGAADKAKEIAKYIADNGKTIIKVVGSIASALATMFVVNKVATFVGSISTLIGVFGGLKTATEGATVATRLLGLAQKALPLVAIAAGIAGLVVAVNKLKQKNIEAIQSEYQLTAAEKETINATNQAADSYKQLSDARQDASESVTAEFGYLDQLKTEYNNLIDSNGNVKKGYEDRASFIVGELANSLGIERSEIEKNIGKNGELGKSIDELIQKQQAQAMLNANEDAYNTAISKRGEALQNWQQQVALADEKEKAYAQTKQNLADKESYYQQLLAMGSPAAQQYAQTVETARVANEAAKKAYDETAASVKQAESTYVGYNSTIQNYESLSAAIISGNAGKIKTALSNMESNFITAKNGTRATLQQQVTDLTNNYNAMKQAVDSGMPGVTQAQVDAAKDLVDKAKTELDKLAPDAKKSGEKAGKSYADGVGSKSGNAKKSGEKAGKAAVSGASSGAKNAKKTGQTAGQNYAKGVEGAKAKSKKAGQSVAKAGDDAVKKSAKDSQKTGKSTGENYAKGVQSAKGKAETAGKEVGKKSLSGVGKFKDEAKTSGSNFAQGYVNGIKAKKQAAYDAGYATGKAGAQGLKKGQKEGSPSKLTYQSGINFTKGYINGISSMQKTLVKTVKNTADIAIKELAKMSGFNFSDVAQNASTKVANAINAQTSYMLAKMQYQNEAKIKDFDTTISNLEKKRDNKVAALEKKKDKAKKDKEKKKIQKQINAVKSNYSKLINTQNKYKEAYQTASSTMLSEFQSAINEYQTAAQKLIDDTINGITDKYNERYNELINKQDTLIDKLKNAESLFEVSGAGVMTVNDIKEQTKAIEDYTSKLQKIKEKVSSDLFDQIATYDMDQGGAFMDRLLEMSAADLEAYNKAYTEKMQAAQKAGETIYKADFDKVATDYKNELNAAFKDIPKQLESLGNEAMKGFVDGLTKNTDYMDKNVKTFVKSMVDQFKKQLKIKSPSRVMMEIGEYTGEGFDNGLLSVVKQIQNTAREIATAVSSPLNSITADIGGVRSAVSGTAGGGVYGGNVVNNYNLVQNNTSPKALTALETYQARRRQIALVKAATGNL